MQTNLLFQRILIISCIIFCLKSFGKTIVLNINNGNPDGSLYQMNENVVIGDKIRFTNNLNYTISQQNSSFISGPEGNIAINIQPGAYYELELTSETQTMFTFVHMNMPQNKYYNSRINLTFAALGVNERSAKDHGMKVFPNPSRDIMHITSEENIEEITLFDASGKLLFTKKIINTKNNFKENINMSFYVKGRYFLKVKNSDDTYSTIHVIKE
ncbi:T9SS type A sorting domain-containing protein [Chryseobacterium sp. ES2]|uniref:T9SS type A sorting domain-containing protein n=1 Tax=Chryseobacterium metallicongregator TaxID=3073042 RepID=A0ABU1E3E5_9FLAO|nr:T9SS type A sorting domain-containing protein [Chryseobacterium sp. ES2]MDR4952311.1 T9SS type A sorting domain-containing protein [Chryseobacterium sp. ES2]